MADTRSGRDFVQTNKEKQILVTKKPFILASASPRRRKFLEELGIDFTIQVADVNETPGRSESPEDFVRRLAFEKADAVSKHYHASWVFGADTVVVLDGKILGKPQDEAAARSMLQNLSGRCHEVWTGFCLSSVENAVVMQQAVKTDVWFATLSDAVINAYISTGEPLDKAGSYGIQGKGGFFVEQIHGSYSNVVGLPLSEVVTLLMKYEIVTAGDA